MPLLEMALRWTLGRPVCTSVLIGASRADQLEAKLQAAQWAPNGAKLAFVCQNNLYYMPDPTDPNSIVQITRDTDRSGPHERAHLAVDQPRLRPVEVQRALVPPGAARPATRHSAPSESYRARRLETAAAPSDG